MLVQGASVNRAILQHCFIRFDNTVADAAIAILLPTVKRFSCNVKCKFFYIYIMFICVKN
jgi:hypothetical protein